MQSKEIICTVCPKGCKITIYKDPNSPDGFKVEGNVCKRGRTYAIAEMTDPRRILTTTVKIKKAIHSRLPVRTLKAVPKDKIWQCMKEINNLEVTGPVHTGDILIENIADTGINLVSSRDM
jgi:CxxC motif-containing protein